MRVHGNLIYMSECGIMHIYIYCITNSHMILCSNTNVCILSLNYTLTSYIRDSKTFQKNLPNIRPDIIQIISHILYVCNT